MGRITGVRGDTVVRTPPLTEDETGSSTDRAQEMMANELVNLTSKTIDLSRPVHEYQNTPSGATQLEVIPEYSMNEIIESIIITAPETTTAPAITSPNGGSALSTTVTQQNPFAFPCQVVIAANGATITAVVVNGVTVGTAAGTYFVPQYGGISLTYTVATPTWVWTQASPYSNVVTLQLGYNLYYIDMAVWGGMFIANGLGIRLSQHDRRIVSQKNAGALGIDLMGHADMQGAIGGP